MTYISFDREARVWILEIAKATGSVFEYFDTKPAAWLRQLEIKGEL